MISGQEYYQFNSLQLKKTDEIKILEIYERDSIFCYIDFADNFFRLEVMPVPSAGSCLYKNLVMSNKYIKISQKMVPVVTFFDKEFLSYDECDLAIRIHGRNSKSTVILIKYPISFPIEYEILWPIRE